MSRRKLPSPARIRPAESLQQPLFTEPGGYVDSAPIAVREVLGLPIRLLREMPLASTLVCSFAHEGGRVFLATASPASVPGDPPAPAFVGPEVDALALAAEHERANSTTMRAWCAKKPEWSLTTIEAIGIRGKRPAPLGWSVEQVLRALGLRLDEVRL